MYSAIVNSRDHKGISLPRVQIPFRGFEGFGLGVGIRVRAQRFGV